MRLILPAAVGWDFLGLAGETAAQTFAVGEQVQCYGPRLGCSVLHRPAQGRGYRWRAQVPPCRHAQGRRGPGPGPGSNGRPLPRRRSARRSMGHLLVGSDCARSDRCRRQMQSPFRWVRATLGQPDLVVGLAPAGFRASGAAPQPRGRYAGAENSDERPRWDLPVPQDFAGWATHERRHPLRTRRHRQPCGHACGLDHRLHRTTAPRQPRLARRCTRLPKRQRLQRPPGLRGAIDRSFRAWAAGSLCASVVRLRHQPPVIPLKPNLRGRLRSRPLRGAAEPLEP
jgi:hypothetical protein